MDIQAGISIAEGGPRGAKRYRSAEAVAEEARRLEELGYCGLYTSETDVDPFLALVPAASATSRVTLGTNIALALARSPMTTAATAHQLQHLTDGRFVLGIGSQIRPHITRRFGMPWDRPAARMEAHIGALRAIWHSWRTGGPLDFRSDFFTLDLMTPGFTPPDHGHPDPPIVLAAVGPGMTTLAGRVADGLITHPFTTPSYLHEVTLPAVDEGLRSAGRSRNDFRISGNVLTAGGGTEEELAASVHRLRERIAFYGSTPAYRPVLEHHGWGDLGDRLHALSRSSDLGRWAEMGRLVPDEVMTTFGAIGTRDEIRATVTERFGGLIDQVGGEHLVPSAR